MSTRTWAALLLSLLMVACGGGGSDAAGGPDGTEPTAAFTLAVEPASLAVGQGREVRLSVSVTRDAGFSEPVVVSLKDAPEGVSSAALELTGGIDQGLLPVRVAADLPVGTVLNLQVQATGGASIRSGGSTLTVAAPKPFAQQLIAAALGGGRIDHSTSLLYRAYALFGDARLPEEFVGDGSLEEDNLLFEEMRRSLGAFPPERQAALRAYLVRPTDPASVWYRSSAASTTPQRATTLASGTREGLASTERRLALPPETCTSLQDGEWISKRSASHPVRVWMQCGPRWAIADETVVSVVGRVLDVLNKVYGPMTAMLGEPRSDLAGGGDGAIDFYVVNDGDSVNRRDEKFFPTGKGVTYAAEPWLGNQASAFVLIPRSTGLLPEGHLTIIHEFFHVLQNSHNARLHTPIKSDCGPPPWAPCSNHWFVEASAAWATAHFDRTAGAGQRAAYDATYFRFGKIFQPSHAALNATDDGVSNHDYSAFIWPYFVEQETKSTAFMTQIWSGLESVVPAEGATNAFAAADDVIDKAYPFEQHFRRFAVRNLNHEFIPNGPLPKSERHVELDPSQFAAADNVEPPYLTRELVAESPYLQALELANLSARYVQLTMGLSTGIRKVEIDASGLTPAGSFSVQAIILTEKGWIAKPVDLDVGKTEFCFDLGPTTETVRGSFEGMVLVLANHGLRPDDIVKGDLKVTPSATPCATIWSGTIRQTIRSETSVDTTTITTWANVAFEFDDLADPVAGEIPFRLKSGTWTFELRTDSTGRNPPCRAVGFGSGALPLTPYAPQVPSGSSAGLIISPADLVYSGSGTSIVTVTMTDNCNDANEDRTTVDSRYWLFWWNEPEPGYTSDDGNSIRRTYTGPNGVAYEISLDKTPRGN